MGGRGLGVLAALLIGLAGCASSSPAPATGGSEGSAPAAPEPKVDQDTGALQVSVTDDSLSPIPHAMAGIVEAQLEAETDDAGRATFNGLAPGTYTVGAQALGYASRAEKAVVNAGEVTPLRFILSPVASEEAYHDAPLILKGLWTLAIDTLVAVPNTGVANNEHHFGFHAKKNWNTTLIELDFRFSNPGSATTPGAWFNSAASPDKSGDNPGTKAEVFGKTSPVRAELRAGERFVNAQGQPEGSPYPEGAYTHSSYAFPVGLLSDETTPPGRPLGQSRGVGVALQQPFTVYVTISYFGGLPDAFTAIPEG